MANLFQDIASDNDDLFIDEINGDFSILPSDEQHIADIIQANQGEYKEFPQVGVGILRFLKSSGKEQEVSRDIRVQLEMDGYVVENPLVEFSTDGKAVIDPNAYRNEQ